MGQIKNFEEMDVWKKSRVLVKEIYDITNEVSFAKDYHFKDHIRRTAISVPSNIAEGFERDGNKEFIQFLSIAKGSCGELRCQLILALDQNYIEQTQYDELYSQLSELSFSLSRLMGYLKSSQFKGRKYK